MSGNLMLASYPKSGNTWLRIFLWNLRRDSHQAPDINALDDVFAATSQSAFDDAVGVEATTLSDEEIDLLRPGVYRYLARINTETVFLKTHEVYRFLPNGEPTIPADATLGAIYVLRNPFDVAISLANHLSCSVDRVIDDILSKEFIPRRRFLSGQTRMKLSPWGKHVLSWVDQTAFPSHVVRYEDMRAQPLETFTAIARFCGLSCETGRVERALDHSSFELLQRQERERGFRERPPEASSFFRAGKAGAWRGILSQSQVDRIVRDHGTVMQRFGYLPDTT